MIERVKGFIFGGGAGRGRDLFEVGCFRLAFFPTRDVSPGCCGWNVKTRS